MQGLLVSNKRSTRKITPVTKGDYGLNSELENFLNVNASEAYKRPWHRLERGLRLNRLRNFVESEAARLSLSAEDTEALKTRLEKSLEKKLLNSKTSVIYDIETEEIKEIKGLVYHRTADGRTLSNIIDKKAGMTFRKKAVRSQIPEQQAIAELQEQEPKQNMIEGANEISGSNE